MWGSQEVGAESSAMVVGRSHPAWRGVTTLTEFYSQVRFKIGDQSEYITGAF